MTLRLILCVLLSGVALACTSTDPGTIPCAAKVDTLTPKLTVEGTRLIDGLNREIMLRGINTGGSAKVPPFMPFAFKEAGLPGHEGAAPFDEAVETYAARVAEWGFNVARVPFTWEAVEPIRGQYDAEFLTRYKKLLDALGRNGIRTIVDFHQDVFARPFCGDGFPLWAVLDPIDETVEYDCHQWFLSYLDTESPVRNAYDDFWANKEGLRDKFKAMWRHVAKETWAADNTVIGFEIINEPFNGNTVSDKEFAKTILTPFYTELAAEISSVVPDALVFFDSTGIDATSQVTHLEAPDGKNLVFAPHFYDGQIFLTGTWNPMTDYSKKLGQWATKGQTWDMPVLVGEFGIKRSSEDGVEYLRRNYRAMDLHLLHCTQWEYSTAPVDWNDEGMSVINPDGTDSVLVPAMIRAFPNAVAGTIQSFTFNPETLTGTLVYTARAKGTTEISAPLRLYPEGKIAVDIQGATGCHNYDDRRQLLTVHVDTAAEVTITFSPAADR